MREALAAPTHEPQNLSFPLQAIEGAITPLDLFFVRDHFNEPELSVSAWKLKIDGRVARPAELSLADLLESPTKNLEAVLECAGNTAGGSAVSNAVWEGVPLAYLLRQAGVEPGATMVLLEGADSGRLMQDSPSSPYCRLVPIGKCLQPESLIALKLNDRFLPRRNGFPARALFPGWYAMDSVKWLQRITILRSDDPASGLQASGMNKLYNQIVETAPGNRAVTRLTGILVKSAIAWPPDNWKLPAGGHEIRGFAWTGAGLVNEVQFSSDGGAAWTPAKLELAPKPFRWVRWSCLWRASPGEHVLMSRASDDAGNSQLLKRQVGRKDGYELNFCAPVRCSVQ